MTSGIHVCTYEENGMLHSNLPTKVQLRTTLNFWIELSWNVSKEIK